ncbi:hypothetical protein CVIRNUC_000842 [Coccomyxa viridis]|uniref:Uncharacterized protein n=1 Tax=Coccomyxa viridis TaxID=1274662 RepID=A0AAV1HUA5_9CHLO|nr:hypothetical protein CVIRNUC_000842 [Coccomyxa viridis]
MGSCMSTPDHTHSFPCEPPATRRTYSGIYEEREVSERLSEAAKETSGSKNFIKLHGELSALDVREWIINLDLPVIKMRATALEKGLNVILNPILDCVEQLLTRGCLLGSCQVTWQTADISHIPRLVEIACGADGELGTLASMREATAGMLRVLHAICVAGERGELPVPPALLEISSLNRLMSIASRIVGRDLAHESQEAAAQRWRAWQSAASALGLTSQHLAVALSAQSKALMVHMHMAARHGSGRVSFKVAEATAFTDSLKQASVMGLLDATAGGMVVYPSFSRHSSSGGTSPKDTDESHSHPRQLFFERAGDQIVQDEEASPSGKGAERPALFLRRASTGRLWFNTSLIRSTRRQQQYRWAGWLLGQCFANRASVCLPLPELLFDKLLKGPTFQATVEALSEFDAEQAAAVRGVLGLHAKEYKALARGQGLPEDMPKRTLMRLWVKRLLVDEVLWQYSAFSQGFFTSVDRETLKCWRMTAADLAELAAGPQGAAGPQTRRPTAQSLKAAGQLSQKAAQHIATSNEPVVNTLWKAPANGARQVLIQAQASLRTISGLVHSASGTIFSQ